MNNESTQVKTTTFYVIRYLDRFFGGALSFSGDSGINNGWFCSLSGNTVDDVPHYPTLCDAMKRWAKNTFDPCHYQIVRVDRTTTPGVTKRRLLREGEPVPANSKIALANPYSRLDGSPPVAFYDGTPNSMAGVGLEKAALFSNHAEVVCHIASVKNSSYRTCGANLVRVVEEITPPITSDVLAVVQ